jgi:hypothetical protein
MTQEEFIKELDEKGYSYEIEGDFLVPSSVAGSVWLESLTSLPTGVKFKNKGHVYLFALKSLPSGVEFRNGGDVWLRYRLTSISPGVVFKNGGDVRLSDLIGGDFHDWKGNIDGIDNKMLLNLMISKGLFER